jgi:CheY-like chemotaxis protein
MLSSVLLCCNSISIFRHQFLITLGLVSSTLILGLALYLLQHGIISIAKLMILGILAMFSPAFIHVLLFSDHFCRAVALILPLTMCAIPHNNTVLFIIFKQEIHCRFILIGSTIPFGSMLLLLDELIEANGAQIIVWSRINHGPWVAVGVIYLLVCGFLLLRRNWIFFLFYCGKEEINMLFKEDNVEITQFKDMLPYLAHSIRTPLHTLLSSCSLLDNSQLSQQQNQLFQLMKDAADAIVAVVNTIMEAKVLESGKLMLNIARENIWQSIDVCINVLQPLAITKNIRLNSFIHSKLPRFINYDRYRIEQIIMNLLGIAINLTDNSGQVMLKAGCEEDQEGNTAKLVLIVTDNGKGMSAETVKKLISFEGDWIEAPLDPEWRNLKMCFQISNSLAHLMHGKVYFRSQIASEMHLAGDALFAELQIEKSFEQPQQHNYSANQPMFLTVCSKSSAYLLSAYCSELGIKVFNLDRHAAVSDVECLAIDEAYQRIPLAPPSFIDEQEIARKLKDCCCLCMEIDGEIVEKSIPSLLMARNQVPNPALLKYLLVLYNPLRYSCDSIAQLSSKYAKSLQIAQSGVLPIPLPLSKLCLLQEVQKMFAENVQEPVQTCHPKPAAAAISSSSIILPPAPELQQILTEAHLSAPPYTLHRLLRDASEASSSSNFSPSPKVIPTCSSALPAASFAEEEVKAVLNEMITDTVLADVSKDEKLSQLSPIPEHTAKPRAKSAQTVKQPINLSSRTIVLPTATPLHYAQSANLATTVGSSPYPPALPSTCTVLIIDDVIVNAKILAKILKLGGIKTEMLYSALAAVDRLKDSTKPLITHIITDIHMPVMDGIELTKVIRHLDQQQLALQPVIIGFTASPSVQLTRRGLAAGMQSLLTKPIKSEQLFKAFTIHSPQPASSTQY